MPYGDGVGRGVNKNSKVEIIFFNLKKNFKLYNTSYSIIANGIGSFSSFSFFFQDRIQTYPNVKSVYDSLEITVTFYISSR